jgi:TatD DNase family protein
LPRDLTPRPKSRRNEPCYLPHIAGSVARLRGEPVSGVAASTTRNAIRLFGLEIRE